MREELSASLLAVADKDTAFLTGDLGYHLFDDLAAVLGPRFVNAGVAEQNMVSVAAGLARAGMKPWVYSIAPFVFARPFEQVRNDVCMHHLPVRLLGNGGGLGYGTLGPTHHAVEDYGVLLTLPHMRVYAPAFDQDVPAVIADAARGSGPCYIRLGRGELPQGAAAPAYSAWRRLESGTAPVTLLTTGTIGGTAWGAVRDLAPASRPNVWLVSELPLVEPPQAFVDAVTSTHVVVVEEHVRQGGLAAMVALWAARNGLPLRGLTSLGLDSVDLGTYGRQTYLRERAGLSPASIREAVLRSVESMGSRL